MSPDVRTALDRVLNQLPEEKRKEVDRIISESVAGDRPCSMKQFQSLVPADFIKIAQFWMAVLPTHPFRHFFPDYKAEKDVVVTSRKNWSLMEMQLPWIQVFEHEVMFTDDVAGMLILCGKRAALTKNPSSLSKILNELPGRSEKVLRRKGQ